MLEALRPDVLILDLCLPVKNGLSVLRETRYKPPVILALTTLWTDQVIEDALDAGVQDMILKPCAMCHIVEHLEQLVKRAPSLEA